MREQLKLIYRKNISETFVGKETIKNSLLIERIEDLPKKSVTNAWNNPGNDYE